MALPILRIHPAIGMARVGNSNDYYIAPESMAGEPQDGSDLTGGLPIKPGTERTPISSADLRDSDGALKRQAARFRVYHYPNDTPGKYPSGADVSEVTIGSKLGHRKVIDIVWTVHLANKKAACWLLDEQAGLRAYDGGKLPPLRNPHYPDPNKTAKADDPKRLRDLIIDAGPRTIASHAAPAKARFDANTTPSIWQHGKGLHEIGDYPKQFPGDAFAADDLYTPTDRPSDMPSDSGKPENSKRPIDFLGEMTSDDQGRLLLLGGHGRATGFTHDGDPPELHSDVNNDQWFDDTSDGPVTAVVLLDDGTQFEVQGSGWAVVTDPSYAPQIRNAVTLWDDVYDTWIKRYDLQPEVYDSGKKAYNKDYKPSFESDIKPIFIAAGLQQWATNLSSKGVNGHQSVTRITADDDPQARFDLKSFLRDSENKAPPDDGTAKGSTNRTAPLMPLSLGDAGYALLTLSDTQYFFMKQWEAKTYAKAGGTALNAGEHLDKATLVNCLGGRFNPGIDMTFIVRDPELYKADWTDPSVGPFRIDAAELDYSKAASGQPFLSVGYTPERKGTKVEPGDICKFMAIPWHTDYNSCATHVPSPNPGGELTDDNGNVVDDLYDGRNLTTFWSWPAQRPVATYTFQDLSKANGKLPDKQRFCVRGTGTPVPQRSQDTPFPAQHVGRYQDRVNILVGWDKVGVILQAPAIEGFDGSKWSHAKDYYLEAENRLTGPSDAVDPWPITVTSKVYPDDS